MVAKSRTTEILTTTLSEHQTASLFNDSQLQVPLVPLLLVLIMFLGLGLGCANLNQQNKTVSESEVKAENERKAKAEKCGQEKTGAGRA